ncbi:MAG: hypothetical protein ACYSWX_09205 [Planctomycetota bacterium]|jgi:membrane protein YqaA with SNARE-associated domain
MLKSFVGSVLGAITLATISSVTGVLMEWFGFDSTFVTVAGVSAVIGAVLGWILPGLFIKPLLFFLEPDIFD